MSFQLYYRRIKPNYYGNTVVLLQTQFSGGFVGANWVYTLTASATPDKTKCFQRIYSINVFERKETWAAEQGGTGGTCTPHLFWKGVQEGTLCESLCVSRCAVNGFVPF